MTKRLVLLGVLLLTATQESVVNAQPCATLTLSSETVAPGEVATVRVVLDSACTIVSGWSYGVCHDATHVEISDVAPGQTTATVDAGGLPSFYAVFFHPGAGFSVGAALSFSTPRLPPGSDYELNLAAYDTVGVTGVSMVEFCDTLGTPPVAVQIAVGTLGVTPLANPGSITIVGTDFVRGDCSADGAVNLADAVFALAYLFPIGNPTLPCRDACDCNDDGSVNLADAICTLSALFGVLTVPPPAPYPGCGVDPTADGLDCGSFVTCP
ncbi:MAG: dockerin type I repeat-containing protein [Planctomycetota bacterium]